MKKLISTAFVIVMLLYTIGCNTTSNYDNIDNIENKAKQGRNTGTPVDLYNRNPYSVFDSYSPYNIYQNP